MLGQRHGRCVASSDLSPLKAYVSKGAKARHVNRNALFGRMTHVKTHAAGSGSFVSKRRRGAMTDFGHSVALSENTPLTNWFTPDSFHVCLARKEVGELHFASHRRFRTRIHGRLGRCGQAGLALGDGGALSLALASIDFVHGAPTASPQDVFATRRRLKAILHCLRSSEGFEGCARGPSSLARTRWRVPGVTSCCTSKSFRSHFAGNIYHTSSE